MENNLLFKNGQRRWDEGTDANGCFWENEKRCENQKPVIVLENCLFEKYQKLISVYIETFLEEG